MPTLFKYVTADRLDVLRNGCLRFTQPHLFNDPFEMQIPITSLEGEAEDGGPTGAIIDELRRTLFVPNLYEQVGLLCLTEKWDNLLMWAHYADHHRGFCLELDGDNQHFNRRSGPDDLYHHLAKVTYTQQRPTTSFRDYLSLATFVTKSLEWEYEQEWRMVLPFSDEHRVVKHPAGDIHLFHFPPECLTGVIFGCRMEEARRDEIIELLRGDRRYRHVEIRQAQLDKETFTLSCLSIDEAYCRRGLESLARAFRWQVDPKKALEFAEAALPDLTRAIELRPGRADFRMARGGVHQLFTKDLAQALADYNAAIELEPDNADYLFERGRLHVERQEPDPAIADFDCAAGLGHEDAAEAARQVREQKARFAIQTPRVDELLDDLDAAVAFEAWESAIEAGEQLLELRIDSETVRTQTAVAYKERGWVAYTGDEFKTSLVNYKRSVELNPEDPDTYFRRGLAHAALANSREAVRDFGRAIDKNNNEPSYRFHRAQSLGHLGKYAKALADLDHIIKQDDDQPQYYALRAEIHARLGDQTKARADRGIAAFIERTQARQSNA